jgi:hypothetical protein
MDIPQAIEIPMSGAELERPTLALQPSYRPGVVQ